MNYDILIFDADETLYDFGKSERYALQHASLDLGIQYDETYHLPIYAAINETIWKEFELGQITQEELKAERFRRFIAKLEEPIDCDKLSAAYLTHLADASFLLNGSYDLIEALHPHYRMVIVTNGLTSVQKKRIRASILAPFFEDVIISEEINQSKPNPGIFDYALHAMKYTNKKKVLMIGDSLTSDIKGGNNAGIDTCWYNPNHKKNTIEADINYEVCSYQELKELLLPQNI
ncbi:MAG: YjjG family noncanonical pyrimidine nucleotidase [Velocimicrobium sp.]